MQAQAIARRCSTPNSKLSTLHPVLQRLYSARGILSPDQLDYGLNNLLSPNLKGLSQATALLCTALDEQQKILIVGDFDADGATSTALAVRCLNAFGHSEVEFLVPNRFEYGYGLTPEIVEVAAGLKPALIVTVDNGIASLEGVARAQGFGIKVLVTDHHLPGQELPKAEAIVNPNQPGCEFISKCAAGVGVVFYLMLALRSALRERGWFNAERPEPNLAQFLDLVALGTVADVVPLDYNNRILVSQGLRRMRAGSTVEGVKALMIVAARSIDSVKTSDLGFMVGPRLNAAGRLDDMSLGIRCLLTDDPGEAMALAQELDALNRDRRAIEGGMQQEALRLLEQMQVDTDAHMPEGLCLFHREWHQGVIGILASRIKDKYHRPVVVFAEDDNGGLKGSGRSIAGVHLRDVLEQVATQNPGLLTKFGGHAMAAGLSLAKQDLAAFTAGFAQAVSAQLGPEGITPTLETDGELEAQFLNIELAEMLEAEGPWGQAFPEPLFDGEFHLIQQKIVGEKHLKMVLAPLHDPSALIDAIAFNADTQCWPNPHCERIFLTYKLSVNEFRGRKSCQLMASYLQVAAG